MKRSDPVQKFFFNNFSFGLLVELIIALQPSDQQSYGLIVRMYLVVGHNTTIK